MATVRDLITDALLDINAIAVGETASAEDAAFCFRRLNNMIATWNNESLMIYNVVPQLFPVVAGQVTYTMGIGGDFNVPRPVKIEDAYISDANNNDYAMAIVDFERYSQIVSKNVQSSIPLCVWVDGSYPLKNLTFWPVPSDGSYRFKLWVWVAVSEFTTIDDVISLPPGYYRALQTNLSMEISPAFTKPVTPDLGRMAVESKAWLKRTNTQIKEMFMPDTLQSPVRGLPYSTFASGNF